MAWHHIPIWLNSLFPKDPVILVCCAYWKHPTVLWWPPNCTRKVPVRLTWAKPMPKTVLRLRQLINFLNLCSGAGSFASTDTTFESEPRPVPHLCLFSIHPSVLQPPLSFQLSQIPPGFLFLVSALVSLLDLPVSPRKHREDRLPVFVSGIQTDFSWPVPGQCCNDGNNSCLCQSLPGERRVTGESGFGNLHL